MLLMLIPSLRLDIHVMLILLDTTNYLSINKKSRRLYHMEVEIRSGKFIAALCLISAIVLDMVTVVGHTWLFSSNSAERLLTAHQKWLVLL